MTNASAAPRHAVHCPTLGCGLKLGEVAGESATFWRVCPDCGATIRYDLPARRWTVEAPPKRTPKRSVCAARVDAADTQRLTT